MNYLKTLTACTTHRITNTIHCLKIEESATSVGPRPNLKYLGGLHLGILGTFFLQLCSLHRPILS